MGPNPMAVVLIRAGKFGYTDTEERRPRDNESRDWSDTAAR